MNTGKQGLYIYMADTRLNGFTRVKPPVFPVGVMGSYYVAGIDIRLLLVPVMRLTLTLGLTPNSPAPIQTLPEMMAAVHHTWEEDVLGEASQTPAHMGTYSGLWVIYNCLANGRCGWLCHQVRSPSLTRANVPSGEW